MDEGRTAFAITADEGIFGTQAVALARSIRTTHPKADIVVFVPDNGESRLSDDLIGALEEVATVEFGPYPDPSYPITSKLRAFELAASRPNVDRAVMLDTDIVLLNELTWPSETAALVARPCTLRGSFWTSAESTKVWNMLYDRYELDPPEEAVSAVLGGDLPYPFYNSAVVIAQDLSLPGRLLDRTLDIRENAREAVIDAAGSETPLFYSDQVALSLLAQEVSFEILPLENNYPVPAFLRTPSSVAGLHYGNREFLATALPGAEMDAYADLLELDASASNWARRIVSVVWFRLANYLPYGVQTSIRRLADSRHAP